MAQPAIKWQAPEFEYRAKSQQWYWISMAVALVALIAAVWQKNFLFGFFIVVAEILLIVWGNREPQLYDFELGAQNLTISKRQTYPYSQIAAFSIFEHEHSEWADVLFHLRRQLSNRLRVKIPRHMVEDVRVFLSTRVAYVEHEETFTEILERFLHF